MFVLRLKSGKWTQFEYLDEVEEVEHGPENIIHVQKMDSVLPADFIGLSEHVNEPTNNQLVMRDEYSLDLTTFRAVRYDMEPKEVGIDSERLVVSYKGVTMVIPASLKGFEYIIINDDAIFINHNHVVSLVLPLEYPDYRLGYGIYVDTTGENELISQSSSGFYFSDYFVGTITKTDFHTKSLTPIVKVRGVSSRNLASYNGLSWFILENSMVAVLNDSGTAYYRKDRVIVSAEYSVQGNKKFEGDRYMIRARLGDLCVVDMLTGILTRVRGVSRLNSCGLVPGHWFPGFSNGVFGVWAFTDECFTRLHEELEEKRGVEEKDEYFLTI